MQGGADTALGAVICILRLNQSKSIWSYYSRAFDDWMYGIRPTSFNPESIPVITGGRFVLE